MNHLPAAEVITHQSRLCSLIVGDRRQQLWGSDYLQTDVDSWAQTDDVNNLIDFIGGLFDSNDIDPAQHDLAFRTDKNIALSLAVNEAHTWAAAYDFRSRTIGRLLSKKIVSESWEGERDRPAGASILKAEILPVGGTPRGDVDPQYVKSRGDDLIAIQSAVYIAMGACGLDVNPVIAKPKRQPR